MSYGADFATADPGNAPLDPVIMIGAAPSFWGAILLIILAVGLIGWIMGQHFARSKVDAAEAIWNAVNDAVKDAMKASTEALPDRAGNMHRVLQDRLGKTLKFGGDLGKNIKDLEAAIKGEIEDKAPAAPPAAKVEAGSKEAGTGSAATAAAAAANNVTIVSLCPQPTPAPAVAPVPPAKPENSPAVPATCASMKPRVCSTSCSANTAYDRVLGEVFAAFSLPLAGECGGAR
jgi:hypothetical protein